MTPTACWNAIGVWGDRACPELAGVGHCRNCGVYSAGAARLLDVPLSAAQLEESARLQARPRTALRRGARAAVVFRLGREWFALPTRSFDEITRLKPVHPLPHRRDGRIDGLVNVRGELLVCVSLATALGVAAAPATSPTARLAVLQHAGGRLAFLADEIAALHRYDDAEIAAAPATITEAAGFARGLLTWEQRPVALLDEPRLFAALERALA